ncbi:MAG: hypothetical protein ACKVX9_19220 [Blastocatellia bacterium]
MKTQISHSKSVRWFLSLALLLTTTLAAAPRARADADPRIKLWTSVGSAGAIDEADLGKLVLQGPIVSFPEAPIVFQPIFLAAHIPMETISAVVRYNVVATDATVEGGGFLTLRARFRDDGANAQVLLRLFEVNIDTGATSLLLTLDSNAFPAQSNFQNQAVAQYTGYKPDFVNNAYFVEALLVQKRSPLTLVGGGRPGLAILQLYKTGGPIS